MESTLTKALKSTSTAAYSASPITILSLLHFRRLSASRSPPPSAGSFLIRRLSSAVSLSRSAFFSPVRHVRPVVLPSRCISHSSASFVSGGGRGGGGLGGGGGGGDGSESGLPKVAAVDDVAPLSPDAIVLDVGGMTCGGCAAKVKKILENQPQVSSATVNLATETAIVWPATEAMVVPNWREELGETLAKHLTNCGFESNPRGEGDNEEDIPL